MQINRGYKFRIYPNQQEQQFLARSFGAKRWVYNRFLRLRSGLFARFKKGKTKVKPKLSGYDLKKLLPRFKKKKRFAWLKEVNSQVLQESVFDLENAFQGFFKMLSKYPRYKKKNGHQSITIPQHFTVHKNKIYIPKLKSGIKAVFHRKLLKNGKIKTITISKEPSGAYYASLNVEFEPIQAVKTFLRKVCGIDLGLISFIATSYQEKVASPKFLRRAEVRIKKASRRLSRKVPGSKNFKKQKYRLAVLHETVRRKRFDFLHKLSRKIADENQVIYLENLAVKNMVKNRKLSKSIQDAGWGEFVRQLLYKGNVVKIGRWDRTTGICPECDHKAPTLTLDQRTWTCEKCLIVNDRDYASAIIIEKIGQVMPDSTPVERQTAAKSRFKRPRKSVSMKQESRSDSSQWAT